MSLFGLPQTAQSSLFGEPASSTLVTETETLQPKDESMKAFFQESIDTVESK